MSTKVNKEYGNANYPTEEHYDKCVKITVKVG